MQLTTRFDKGNKVYVIHNNKIMLLEIISLKYERVVSYTLMVKKAFQSSLGDRDDVIEIDETYCFISMAELSSYWTNKLNAEKK